MLNATLEALPTFVELTSAKTRVSNPESYGQTYLVEMRFS
jgi:hypothetical protein